MFLRRRKKELEEARPLPPGVPVPGHVGELWHILQSIAREEDPAFAEKSVVEHFNSSAEAQRDVTRWLDIYQRRLDPGHAIEFPAHWRRHRGFVMGPRNWPSGILHEAFDAATGFRAPFGPARTEEELIQAADLWSQGQEKPIKPART